MVRFFHVSGSYGSTRAVSDLDLEVRPGEFFALLGLPGSGKSTVLKMLAGLLAPASGVIELDGRVVSDPARRIAVPVRRRGIGLVPQGSVLWPALSVRTHLQWPMRVSGIPAAERQERTERVLSLLRLRGLERRLPSELSPGQRQRLALARALSTGPRVLLLDEPLNGLMPALREDRLAEIAALQRRMGITVIYATRNRLEALAASDRVGLLHRGRLRQVGPPLELFETPAEPLVAAYVGRASFFRVDRQGLGLFIRVDGERRPLGVRQVSGTLNRGLGCARPGDIELVPAELLSPRRGELRCRIRQTLFAGESMLYRVQVGSLMFRVRSADRSFAGLSEAGLRFHRVTLF